MIERARETVTETTVTNRDRQRKADRQRQMKHIVTNRDRQKDRDRQTEREKERLFLVNTIDSYYHLPRRWVLVK